jgi:hypothetical protein
MARRLWIPVVGLLIVVPVADAILWRFAVGRLEAGYLGWVANSKTAGWTVTRGRAIASGWPWAASLEMTNVAIEGGETLVPGGVAWHAAQLIVRVPLMHPHSLEIEMPGAQRFRAGTAPEVTLSGARVRAVASLGSPDQARDIEVLGDQPELATNPGGILTADRVRVHIQLPPLVRPGDAAPSFSFSATAVVLPATTHWALGNTIAQLDFDGTMEGPVPPAQPAAQWAAAWRDGGGSLQLQNLVMAWGPLNLTASATLALDDQLQPMGAGTSRMTGYGATLDALAASGVLSRSAATAAKAVLSLLAGTPGDGDPADVDVPLTLQYRTLSMRQVPLLRLPEVEWPGQ